MTAATAAGPPPGRTSQGTSTGTLPLVQVTGLHKHFPIGPVLARRVVRAVNDVCFDIAQGETLGLVGESGSGKSTLGRVMIGLTPPTAGRSVIAGRSAGAACGADRRAFWRRSQMVFQDPYSSLNPRMTIRDALTEPLRNFGIARGAEADRIIRSTLDACGLPASALPRYPREFSGGQRQRVGIARALIVRPDFIIADEPVSALDVSIQAQIVNLLQDLQQGFGLTYLFIAHDLAVVRHVSDRVAVMYLGKIVEIGRPDVLYSQPRHPYTQLLLRSVPVPDVALERARRAAVTRVQSRPMPPPGNGCPFAPRCPAAQFPTCAEQEPRLAEHAGPGHSVACHFAGADAAQHGAKSAPAAAASRAHRPTVDPAAGSRPILR